MIGSREDIDYKLFQTLERLGFCYILGALSISNFRWWAKPVRKYDSL